MRKSLTESILNEIPIHPTPAVIIVGLVNMKLHDQPFSYDQFQTSVASLEADGVVKWDDERLLLRRITH